VTRSSYKDLVRDPEKSTDQAGKKRGFTNQKCGFAIKTDGFTNKTGGFR
jgi:hypothetical protein